jgi:hypothetical protein
LTTGAPKGLARDRIALVVLTGSTKRRFVQQHIDRIAPAVASFDARLRSVMRPAASRCEREEDEW